MLMRLLLRWAVTTDARAVARAVAMVIAGAHAARVATVVATAHAKADANKVATATALAIATEVAVAAPTGISRPTTALSSEITIPGPGAHRAQTAHQASGLLIFHNI